MKNYINGEYGLSITFWIYFIMFPLIIKMVLIGINIDSLIGSLIVGISYEVYSWITIYSVYQSLKLYTGKNWIKIFVHIILILNIIFHMSIFLLLPFIFNIID